MQLSNHPLIRDRVMPALRPHRTLRDRVDQMDVELIVASLKIDKIFESMSDVCREMGMDTAVAPAGAERRPALRLMQGGAR